MKSPWPSIKTEKAEGVQPVQVTAVNMSNESDLAKALTAAFSDAMAERHQLPEDVFDVVGFSGRKFRMFLNNLMKVVDNPRYLEIGLFHGASFVPAIYNNRVRAVGVDNWEVRGNRPEPFMENYNRFKHELADTEIVSQDFRKVDYEKVGPFNILFFDGPHRYEDQYDGINLPLPAMDDQFILIVDDWNWDRVRKATFDVLRDVNLKINYQIEVRTTFANDPAPLVQAGRTSEWNNGIFIGLVTKIVP